MYSVDTPDHELVASAQGGDRYALEVLLRRHYDRVLVLCRRICRSQHDAEDCAQNALIAITRALASFDGSSTFSTWSYRVTTNCCLDELRRRNRRPVLIDNDDSVAAVATSAEPDPQNEAVRSEQRRLIQEALDELPDEFRLPVVLRDVAGYDYSEIAETLNLAPGTVRSRISRARRRLAATLAASMPDQPSGNQRDPRDVVPLERP